MAVLSMISRCRISCASSTAGSACARRRRRAAAAAAAAALRPQSAQSVPNVHQVKREQL